MIRTCECCGHPLPPEGVKAALTPVQRRIFEALERAGTAGLSRERLLEIVYGDDPGGGPENRNIISVHRNHMAGRLAAFGLEIATTFGHGAIWKLKLLPVTSPLP